MKVLKEDIYTFRHVFRGLGTRQLEDIAFDSGTTYTIDRTTGWIWRTFWVTFRGPTAKLRRAANLLGYRLAEPLGGEKP